MNHTPIAASAKPRRIASHGLRPLGLGAACALLMSACGGGSADPLATLDGAAPLVIAHRGLPGLYPE